MPAPVPASAPPPAALDVLAWQGLRSNDLDMAFGAFEGLVRDDPSDAFAHAWLGRVAARAGGLVRAEQAYEAALGAVTGRMFVDAEPRGV